LPVFKDLKSIEKHLQKGIDKALKQDVAPVVKKTEQEHIESDVYGAYEPKIYKRRGSGGGGLGDMRNMLDTVSKFEQGSILSVFNKTPYNPLYTPFGGRRSLSGRYIGYSVEYGVDYDWGLSDDAWLIAHDSDARPFIENTVTELASGKLEESLKQGLKKQGIDAD